MVNWRKERLRVEREEAEERLERQRSEKRFEKLQEDLAFQLSGNVALDAHDKIIRDFLGMKRRSWWGSWWGGRPGSEITAGGPRFIDTGPGYGMLTLGPRRGHWDYLEGDVSQDWGRNTGGLYVKVGAPFPSTDWLVKCLARA